MDLADLVAATTVLANVATFLGIPLAIIVLMVDRHRVRQDRERQTFQALQQEYTAFLRLCLERPELRLHDYRPDKQLELTAGQLASRMVALEILVSMFESAFFHYHHGHGSKFKKRQWTGWEEFMRDWASREDFRIAWREHLVSEFDSEFTGLMDRFVREGKSAA